MVPWLEVVGVAANGKIGIDKMKSLKADVVTLDLEMPEMNGLETLREMKIQGLKQKVIVFSAASQKGAALTLEALGGGALDFVAKPGPGNPSEGPAEPAVLLRKLLVPKLEAFFRMPKSADVAPVPTVPLKSDPYPWNTFHPEAILIGCSTGGPNALEKIFASLKGPFQIPVFIIQHMPPVFTASLAGRLGKITGVPASEAVHNEIAEANHIYVVPGNFHMQIEKVREGLKLKLNQEPLENSVRPAVDQTFRTAAEVFHSNCLGIILTGMGRDGLLGSQALRQAKNPIIIQNRESCIVFGMPGSLFEVGAYDSIQSLEEIADSMRGYLNKNKGQNVA